MALILSSKPVDSYGVYPDWQRVRQSAELDLRTIDSYDVQPAWARLRPPIELEVSTEYSPSQPFIDGLDPVTVGSTWRTEVLRLAKLEITSTLTVLSPTPSSSTNATSTITIPCGDRIPEMGDVINWVENDPSYTLPDFGLDNDRTILLVNDTVVYRDGSQQNSWTVTSTANDIRGFDYELTGPSGILPIGSVEVSVYLEGVESFQDTFSFTTLETDPPYLDNEDPASSETGVLGTKIVSFDVLDAVSGIDLTTVLIYLEGVLAYNGSTDLFIAPYNAGGSTYSVISGPPDGYSFDIQKTSSWDFLSTISVRVIADDTVGNSLDTTYSFVTADASRVSSVDYGIYEITLDVTFSTSMTQNDALTEPANYQFSGDVYTRLVEVLDSDQVRLWVELFQGSSSFTLTVSTDLKDGTGESLVGRTVSDITPFQSDALMSGTNGRIRTWAGRGASYPDQGSRICALDSERIYVAGSRGIDIFKRETASTVSRWGQIFDEYGIDTMYLANYDDDFVFSDTTDPYLENLSPADGGFTPPTTSPIIGLTITDDDTAVEIISTAVYVNDTLAFSGGSGGWQNGYSGDVRLLHHSVAFTIRPPFEFTLLMSVTVRVIATDLMDNSMDESYSFVVFSFG
jgi:hypothetical protein